PLPLLATDFRERNGQISPDGRWIAYSSDETGRWAVYVQNLVEDAGAFAAGGDKSLISPDGGSFPRWRADGKEIFYLSAEGALMAVEVAAEADQFRPGTPKKLFQTQLTNDSLNRPYDVSADGQRFLLAQPTEDTRRTRITVVLNWQADAR
ncbi:MAG: hypothetical protein GY953_27495, partial [bacterium]|nr:hypothetical protein [bacterium]